MLLTSQKSLRLSMCHISRDPFVSNTCSASSVCPHELWRLIRGNLVLVVPESACQSFERDRWLVEINKLTQHHPFCEQMDLIWQYVYERSGDPLSSYLNILPSPPQAQCYLWQSGPTLLCALMFNSRTHNQGGRRECGCVGKSLRLRSSATLISYKYSPWCTLVSIFVTA